MRKIFALGLVTASIVLALNGSALAANWNQPFQEYMDKSSDNSQQKNLELLDRSLALDSGRNNFQAYEKRGQVLCALGKYDEALEMFDKLIGFQNLFYQEWGNRANANQNNPKEYNGCKFFQKNLCLSRRESYHAKAVALFKLGRYDEALSAFDKGLQFSDEGMRMMGKPSDRASYLNDRATIEAKMGRLDDAAADFDRYIAFKKVNPGYGEKDPQEIAFKLLLEKAVVLSECGAHAQSVRALDALISSWAKESRSWLYCSSNFVKLPHLRDKLDLYILRAKCKENSGGDALSDYGQMIAEFGKSDATVYKHRASYYERHNSMADAQQDYDSGVTLSKESESTLLLRAGFFERQQKLKEAEADYAKIAANTSSLPLANFYLRIGRADKAKEQLDLAVDKAEKQTYFFSGSLRPYSQRAQYYEALGQLDKAIADTTKAESIISKEIARKNERHKSIYLESEDWELCAILLNRAKLHETAGHYDLAKQDLSRIESISPDNDAVTVAKARIKEKQGNLAEALQDYQKVAVNGPPDDVFRSNRPTGEFKLMNQLSVPDAALAVGNFSAAANAINMILKEHDDLPLNEQSKLLLKRGTAYSKQLDHVKALADLEKAERLDAGCAKQARAVKNKVLVALGREPEPEQAAVTTQIARSSSTSKPAQTAKVEAAKRSGPNSPIKDKWALVIGISKFANPEYNLKYAAKDAHDFYDYLITDGKFQKDHVMLLLDEQATRLNIMSAFGTKFLPAVTKDGDLVVVYVSTHGTPASRDPANKNFIVAHDTNADALYETGVNMDELYSRVKAGVKTDRALIVMDTCYSGAGVPGARGVDEYSNFDAAEVAQGFGHLVVSSSSPNEKSWESKVTRNGVFTKYLIQNLKLTHGNVKAAFDKVKDDVGWEVQNAFNKGQHPQMGGEWEGNELILSVPSTEHRQVHNPDLIKMLNINYAKPQSALKTTTTPSRLQSPNPSVKKAPAGKR